MDLVFPADHPKTTAVAEAIMSGTNVTNFENRYIRKDGTLVPIVWSATWNADDSIMYCIARDATEKKEMELRLERSNQMFESFMENSPIVGWITDENGVMSYMNASYLATYGFTKEDIGKSVYDLFPDQLAVDYYRNNLKVLRAGEPIETIEKGITAGGAEQVLKIYKFPIQLDGRRAVAGWAIDLTEQMQLQQSLEKSLEQFHYVNEATSDAIYDWDVLNHKIHRGSSFEHIFGHTERVISLRRRLANIHPEDIAKYKAEVFSALRSSTKTNWAFEYRFRDAGGVYRHVVDKAFILYKDGRAVRVIGAMQDVTAQRNAQRRLIEQEQRIKWEMVRSVIDTQEQERRSLSVELHDNVNQMLASCKLMLEYAIDNKDVAPRFLEKCYLSVQQIINEIRKISHGLNPSVLMDLGLSEAIEQLVEQVNSTGKITISYTNLIPADARFQEQDRIAVFRLVQEGVNNILKHANASGAEIRLSCSEGLVHLTISDNGKGFDPARSYQGLGFRNIRNRVQFYQGNLDIHSAPGAGCRLHATLNIPLAKDTIKADD
ncbi:hypothetical protein GCM10023184_29100 [Flaviaesturariibacter amylovorans]|uniref:histidine kinase n=2 Tax=Flaviaesturariibacter amylovorans TaxID=1084520 RepID=A0ABP8H5Y6_9BACT